MIRSLVAPINITAPVSANGTASGTGKLSSSEFIPRRNLSREGLETAFSEKALMWMDIVDPTDEEIVWLEEFLRLNPAIGQDLRREDRRPALMVYPDYLFLSLFEPHIIVVKGDEDRKRSSKRHKSVIGEDTQTRLNITQAVTGKEIHCLIGECFFITVRKSNTKAVDDAYDRVAQSADSWLRGVAYFLYLTAQHVIDAYYPLLDRISNMLNDYEERLMANGGKLSQATRKPVYRVKQHLIRLRQMVAPQREVLSSVIGEQRLSDNVETRDLFRHLYERLMRVYDVIDSQRDLSSTVLDMLDNQESRQLVEVVNRLTIFSMVFLPLTFFTGLFELGFATTSDPLVIPIRGATLFVLVIGLMIGSASLMAAYFKRRGWL